MGETLVDIRGPSEQKFGVIPSGVDDGRQRETGPSPLLIRVSQVRILHGLPDSAAPAKDFLPHSPRFSSPSDPHKRGSDGGQASPSIPHRALAKRIEPERGRSLS